MAHNEAWGGVTAEAAPGAPFSPVAQAQVRLVHTLKETLPGQDAWSTWPETAHVTHSPQLLRIGDGYVHEQAAPVGVPLLGEGHVVIGEPGLVLPVKITPQADTSVAEYRQALEAAAKEEQKMRRANIARFRSERGFAVGLTESLIVRAVGTTPKDSLRVTVYDPVDHGSNFAQLAFLNRDGGPVLYDRPTNNIEKLLGSLEQEIIDREYHLKGTPLQAFTGRGSLPFPWHVVALLGNGEQLSAEGKRRLQYITRFGAKNGVSLIMTGFDANDAVTRLTLLGKEWIQSSATPGIPILSDRPPDEITKARTATASRKPAANGVRPMGAQEYRRLVASESARLQAAMSAEERHERMFPELTAEFVREASVSAKQYVKTVGALAGQEDGPASALRQLRDVVRRVPSHQSLIEKFQALATFDLLNQGEHNRLATLTIRPAISSLRQRTPMLSQIVMPLQVEPAIRKHLWQFMDEHPPAWAFQLVAKAAHQHHWAQPHNPHNYEYDAVTALLVHAYGIQPEALQGSRNAKHLHETLAALHLLYLYGYNSPDMPKELRSTLTHYARNSIHSSAVAKLPERSQRTYMAYQEHAQVLSAQAAGQAATSTSVSK